MEELARLMPGMAAGRTTRGAVEEEEGKEGATGRIGFIFLCGRSSGSAREVEEALRAREGMVEVEVEVAKVEGEGVAE